MARDSTRSREVGRVCRYDGRTTPRSPVIRCGPQTPSKLVPLIMRKAVKHSLRANDLTVVSIFVNPAQFAPHEDLDSYPRTLPTDLSKLSELTVSPSISNNTGLRTVDAIFAPAVTEMYPNGIERDVIVQKGTFIEVKGYSHQMEGRSRPDFFRGVATVVTKLFNVVEVKKSSVDRSHAKANVTYRAAHQHIFRSKRHPASASASPNVHRSSAFPS